MEKFFRVDPKIKSILDSVLFPAQNIVNKGSSRVPAVKHRIHNNMLVDYKFKGGPNFVSAERFNKLAEGKTVLYRGVQSEKYRDDLEYDNAKFRGSVNVYQGTWVTDDKEYAATFHYDKEPLRLLLKDDTKIIDDDEANKLWGDFAQEMTRAENAGLEMDDERESKTVLYQAKYLKDNLDPTFLAIMKGYDAVRLYQNPNKSKQEVTVYVVFNRSKLIISR